jgi:acyl carrier protein
VLIAVAAFPLTTSGKLDRRALPAPVTQRSAALTLNPPTSELEQQLTRLWERLLDVRPIGTRDDFFALGGHSLLAVRMIGELKREFEMEIPVSVLFAAPTVERLALALCDHQSSPNRKAIVTLNPEGTAAPFFFLHGSLNGGGFYCLALPSIDVRREDDGVRSRHAINDFRPSITPCCRRHGSRVIRVANTFAPMIVAHLDNLGTIVTAADERGLAELVTDKSQRIRRSTLHGAQTRG